MNTLHMMVGLPRSGKSTIARTLGHPIVEPDSIRLSIHGTPWRASMEPLVWGTARIMVESLFLSGHSDVVLDCTNYNRSKRAQWESEQWVCKFHVVDTDKEECIRRAIASKQEYLVPVINRMAAEWEDLSGNQMS